MSDRPSKFRARYLGTESPPAPPPGSHTHPEADVTGLVADLATKQPLDADLTAFAGKTAPSGAVVGTIDTQALTNKDLTGAGNTFPSTLALDSAVVKLAGTQTITGSKTLDLPVVQTYQGSTPGTPAAGHATGPYFGADGLPYYLTPSGVVVPISIGEVGTALHGNASFETVSGSTPTVWSFFWQNGGSVTTETTDVLFGTRSLTVSTTAGANNQIAQSDVFTVAAGDTVDVGAWAHRITGSPLMEIGVLTAVSGTPDFFDGVSLGQGSAKSALATTFTRYTKSFQVPAGHTVARVFFRFEPTAAEATSSRLDFTTSSRTGASVSILPGNAWVKEACRLVTTAAFAPTTAAPNSVDGVTPAVGDRILKAVAGGASTDGIWTVVTVGSGSNGVWARASDASTSAQVAGAQVAVTTGTTYGGTQWTTSFKATDTFGTTAMVWWADGIYTTFTPACALSTPGTGATFSVTSAKFAQVGRNLIHYELDVQITAMGTGSGTLKFNLPVAADVSATHTNVGSGRETNNNGTALCVTADTSTVGNITYYSNAGAALNNRMSISGTYKRT